MLETFVLWFLLGTLIKLYWDNFQSTSRRRRKAKDKFEDVVVAVFVIILLGLIFK